MNRLNFIRVVLGTAGAATVPGIITQQNLEVNLLSCFVRGLQYYNSDEELQKMHEGDMVTLVREPINKFDPYAIAVYHKSRKAGYIPASANEVLSNILDNDVMEVEAVIAYIDEEAEIWERVFIEVYAIVADKGTKCVKGDNEC